MKAPVVALCLAVAAPALLPADECRAKAGAPRLDHAIVVVRDLAGPRATHDTEEIFAHAGGTLGLREAWVEGGKRLARLLARLGARSCGSVRLPDGRRGVRWALGHGALVVVPKRGGARSPRLLGAVLERPRGTSAPAPPLRILPGFRLG
jgi:hypothetical protein